MTSALTITQSGNSPVGMAVWKGHTECVRMLIETKACVLTPNMVRACMRLFPLPIRSLQDDITPISFAAIHGHVDIIRMLLTANADAQIPDKVLTFKHDIC